MSPCLSYCTEIWADIYKSEYPWVNSYLLHNNSLFLVWGWGSLKREMIFRILGRYIQGWNITYTTFLAFVINWIVRRAIYSGWIYILFSLIFLFVSFFVFLTALSLSLMFPIVPCWLLILSFVFCVSIIMWSHTSRNTHELWCLGSKMKKIQ